MKRRALRRAEGWRAKWTAMADRIITTCVRLNSVMSLPLGWYKAETTLIDVQGPPRVRDECPYHCGWQVEGEAAWVQARVAKHDCGGA